jgi:hypothetical protein
VFVKNRGQGLGRIQDSEARIQEDEDQGVETTSSGRL